MATGQTGSRDAAGEAGDIKRKLALRMGFAGLMIVALLGGLALFDHMSAQGPVESTAPQYTEPVPVPKKVQTQAVTPSEPKVEPASGVKQVGEPEATAVPVDKSVARLEPPPRPEVAAQPSLPRATQSATRPAASAPVAAPTRPTETRVAGGGSVPAPRAETAMPAPMPVQPPAPPRLFSGYAVQAGVFADPRRAEELHAKLMLEGIPSSIEARVQVGPFKTREQAEAARQQLKALGIEGVMLPPKGAKK